MVIGIDASRANHEQKTGVEWYAWHIIQELKIQNEKLKNGDSFRFVLYSDRPLQGDLAKLPANWSSKVLGWSPNRFWTQIRLSWEMLRRPPDVLFIPAHVFPLIHPKKTIMTVHDIAAVKFPKSYNWFERWYSVWSAKYAVKNLWRIIVPTDFVKKEIINSFQAQNFFDKIYVIHHGFDPSYLVSAADDLVLKKLNLQKPYILSVGRLEEKKNTKRMIQAFNLVKEKKPDLKLVLVGRRGHGWAEMEAELNGSVFKKDILLTGWLLTAETTSLMSSASVFVFPSLYEGFGLPILEAFAAGVPVVASRGSSLTEIGGEACAYADALDSREIANKILQILESGVLRNKMIALGRERLRAFSWAMSGEQIVRLLIA